MDETSQEKQGERVEQQTKQQAQLNSPPPPSSPPSASSSPSHEFSFTISLHPSSAPAKIPDTKTKSPPPPPFAAIDLSPADEIFFHGHLLPLHLLAHLPAAAASPRSSTNSLDSFTLPINELLQDNNDNNNNNKTNNIDDDDDDQLCKSSHVLEGKGRGKSKSFSIFFGMQRKLKNNGCECESKDHIIIDDDDDQKKKAKSKFDLVKRYMRLVKPFLSFRNRREKEFLRRRLPPYSYSENLRERNKEERRGRRGEFSAPASMRTSPTNSGLLVATSGTVTPINKSDSTMEELQTAIQAAIAHCKKSIEAEDRIKDVY